MSREIKYKGLTSNRTWVYGNLIQGKKGDCYICSINENPIYKNGDSWYIDSPCYVVIPETVCQFTGLVDKNEKDIYEGDILKITLYDDEWKTKVRDYYGTLVIDVEGCDWSTTALSFLDDEADKEVLGNFYENPELLTI